MCPHHVSDVKLEREPTSCKNLKVKICIPPSKLNLACYGEQESASRKVADHADHLTSSNGVSIDAPLHELSDYHLYEKGENIIDGQVQPVSIRATTTFRKENGHWKVIGHHTDTLAYLQP